MARSVFKRADMRNVYETCQRRALAGERISGSYGDGYKMGRSGLVIWKGDRTSLKYAAFCAGVDDRSAAIKAGKE